MGFQDWMKANFDRVTGAGGNQPPASPIGGPAPSGPQLPIVPHASGVPTLLGRPVTDYDPQLIATIIKVKAAQLQAAAPPPGVDYGGGGGGGVTANDVNGQFGNVTLPSSYAANPQVQAQIAAGRPVQVQPAPYNPAAPVHVGGMGGISPHGAADPQLAQTDVYKQAIGMGMSPDQAFGVAQQFYQTAGNVPPVSALPSLPEAEAGSGAAAVSNAVPGVVKDAPAALGHVTHSAFTDPIGTAKAGLVGGMKIAGMPQHEVALVEAGSAYQIAKKKKAGGAAGAVADAQAGMLASSPIGGVVNALGGDMMNWAVDNPDAVIQAYEHGYTVKDSQGNVVKQTGPGNAAVLALFEDHRNFGQNMVFQLSTDPTVLIPVVGEWGAALEEASAAGRAGDTAGKIGQAMTAVKDVSELPAKAVGGVVSGANEAARALPVVGGAVGDALDAGVRYATMPGEKAREMIQRSKTFQALQQIGKADLTAGSADVGVSPPDLTGRSTGGTTPFGADTTDAGATTAADIGGTTPPKTSTTGLPSLGESQGVVKGDIVKQTPDYQIVEDDAGMFYVLDDAGNHVTGLGYNSMGGAQAEADRFYATTPADAADAADAADGVSPQPSAADATTATTAPAPTAVQPADSVPQWLRPKDGGARTVDLVPGLPTDQQAAFYDRYNDLASQYAKEADLLDSATAKRAAGTDDLTNRAQKVYAEAKFANDTGEIFRDVTGQEPPPFEPRFGDKGRSTVIDEKWLDAVTQHGYDGDVRDGIQGVVGVALGKDPAEANRVIFQLEKMNDNRANALARQLREWRANLYPEEGGAAAAAAVVPTPDGGPVRGAATPPTVSEAPPAPLPPANPADPSKPMWQRARDGEVPAAAAEPAEPPASAAEPATAAATPPVASDATAMPRTIDDQLTHMAETNPDAAGRFYDQWDQAEPQYRARIDAAAQREEVVAKGIASGELGADGRPKYTYLDRLDARKEGIVAEVENHLHQGKIFKDLTAETPEPYVGMAGDHYPKDVIPTDRRWGTKHSATGLDHKAAMTEWWNKVKTGASPIEQYDALVETALGTDDLAASQVRTALRVTGDPDAEALATSLKRERARLYPGTSHAERMGIYDAAGEFGPRLSPLADSVHDPEHIAERIASHDAIAKGKRITSVSDPTSVRGKFDITVTYDDGTSTTLAYDTKKAGAQAGKERIEALIQPPTAPIAEASPVAEAAPIPAGPRLTDPHPNGEPPHPRDFQTRDDYHAARTAYEQSDPRLAVYNKLSDEEKMAVEAHHASNAMGQTEMSLLHRDPVMVPNWKEVKTSRGAINVRRADEVLTSAIDRNPLPEDTTVYRAIRPDNPAELDALQPGDTFRQPGYMSTTRDPAIAEEWANRGLGGGKKSYVVEVHAPAGTPGLDIPNPRNAAPEEEVLFRPNSEWKVVSVDRTPGQHPRIVVEPMEVPAAAPSDVASRGILDPVTRTEELANGDPISNLSRLENGTLTVYDRQGDLAYVEHDGGSREIVRVKPDGSIETVETVKGSRPAGQRRFDELASQSPTEPAAASAPSDATPPNGKKWLLKDIRADNPNLTYKEAIAESKSRNAAWDAQRKGGVVPDAAPPSDIPPVAPEPAPATTPFPEADPLVLRSKVVPPQDPQPLGEVTPPNVEPIRSSAQPRLGETIDPNAMSQEARDRISAGGTTPAEGTTATGTRPAGGANQGRVPNPRKQWTAKEVAFEHPEYDLNEAAAEAVRRNTEAVAGIASTPGGDTLVAQQPLTGEGFTQYTTAGGDRGPATSLHAQFTPADGSDPLDAAHRMGMISDENRAMLDRRVTIGGTRKKVDGTWVTEGGEDRRVFDVFRKHLAGGLDAQEAIDATMKDIGPNATPKERGWISKHLGGAYNAVNAFGREHRMYGVLKGPVGIAADTLGNAFAAIQVGNFDAAADILNPLKQKKIYNSIREGSAAALDATDTAVTVDRLGLVPRSVSGVAAHTENTGGEFVAQRFTKKIARAVVGDAAGERIGNAVGELASSTRLRDFREAGDINGRWSIYGTEIKKQLPQAREDFFRVLDERAGGTDTALLKEKLGDEFAPEDVLRLSKEAGVPKGQAEYLARSWRTSVANMDAAAFAEQNRVLFDFSASALDEQLKKVFQFHTWQFRAAPFYAQNALRNPVLMSTYGAIFKNLADDCAKREGQQCGYLELGASIGGQLAYMNPAYVLSSALINLDPQRWQDPDATTLDRILRIMPASVSPAFQGIISAIGMSDVQDPDWLSLATDRRVIGGIVNAARARGVFGEGMSHSLGADPYAEFLGFPRKLTFAAQDWAKQNLGANMDWLLANPKNLDPARQENVAIQAHIRDLIYAENDIPLATSIDDLERDHPDVATTVHDAITAWQTGQANPYADQAFKDYTTGNAVFQTAGLAVPGGLVQKTASQVDLAGTKATAGTGQRELHDSAAGALQIAGLGSPLATDLAFGQSAVDQSGTAAGRSVYDAYNQIVYGDNPGNIVGDMFGLTTPDMLKMTTEERQAVADRWIQMTSNPEQTAGLLSTQRDARSAASQANPADADYRDWANANRDGGPAFQQALMRQSPSYRQYLAGYPAYVDYAKKQGFEPMTIAEYGVTRDAYLAANGQRATAQGPGPSTVNATAPYPLMGTGTAATGTGTGQSGDRVASLTNDMRDYSTRLGLYQQALYQLTGNPNVNLDDVEPPLRDALTSKLAQAGISQPSMSAEAHRYTAWAKYQGAQGGPTDMQSYFAFKDKLKLQFGSDIAVNQALDAALAGQASLIPGAAAAMGGGASAPASYGTGGAGWAPADPYNGYSTGYGSSDPFAGRYPSGGNIDPYAGR